MESVMSRLGLAALAVLIPISAHAAAFKAPVEELMAATANNWKEMKEDTETAPDYIDYFNEDFLKRLYSKDLVAKYREAAKYPAYDDGGSPFGYDPIVSGQDGCSLKDLTITEGTPKDGTDDVTVTFDNTHCFPERDPSQAKTTLVFKVIEEDGRPVIDEMVREGEDESTLKEELGELARYGAEAAAGGQ